jgi:hypothetical protein
MWPEHWISEQNGVLNELRRWKGAKAQAWGYCVSHSQLLIRIYWVQENTTPGPTSLWLWLNDCYQVSFQSSWDNVEIRIEQVSGRWGPEYIVTDSDRLTVRCGVFPLVTKTEGYWVRLHERFESLSTKPH